VHHPVVDIVAERAAQEECANLEESDSKEHVRLQLHESLQKCGCAQSVWVLCRACSVVITQIVHSKHRCQQTRNQYIYDPKTPQQLFLPFLEVIWNWPSVFDERQLFLAVVIVEAEEPKGDVKQDERCRKQE